MAFSPLQTVARSRKVLLYALGGVGGEVGDRERGKDKERKGISPLFKRKGEMKTLCF